MTHEMDGSHKPEHHTHLTIDRVRHRLSQISHSFPTLRRQRSESASDTSPSTPSGLRRRRHFGQILQVSDPSSFDPMTRQRSHSDLTGSGHAVALLANLSRADLESLRSPPLITVSTGQNQPVVDTQQQVPNIQVTLASPLGPPASPSGSSIMVHRWGEAARASRNSSREASPRGSLEESSDLDASRAEDSVFPGDTETVATQESATQYVTFSSAIGLSRNGELHPLRCHPASYARSDSFEQRGQGTDSRST